MGADQVRLQIHGQLLPVDWATDAAEWLAGEDRLSRELSAASQASQILTALSAKRAAWIAAAAAITAAILTIIGIIISVLAWLNPHAPSL